METDSFNNINSRLFSQLNKDRLLYFVAFFFKNFNLIKCNYKIYNKK